jgi:HSP20 family protein
MALMRWDPFAEMAALRQQMDRLLSGHGRREGVWMPAIDVIDGEHELTVVAEVPGMKPEDLSITCDEDSLTLSGERHSEERVERGRWASVERHFGRFERSVPLPRTARRDEIEASYNDGVLELRIPKREVAAPQRITIREGRGERQLQGTATGGKEEPMPRKDEQSAQDAMERGRPKKSETGGESAQEAQMRGRPGGGPGEEQGAEEPGRGEDSAQEAQMRGRPRKEDTSPETPQESLERGRGVSSESDEPGGGKKGTEQAA